MANSFQKKIWNIKNQIPLMQKKKKGFKFKYTTLIDIENKLKPIMVANNVGYRHRLTHKSEGNILETIIFDLETEDDEVHSLKIPEGVSLAGMNDYQSLGSALTYFRRYHLIIIFGILTDEDVDAVSPSQNQPPKITTNHLLKVQQLIELGRGKSTLEKYLSTYSSKMTKEDRDTISELINKLQK